MVKQFDVVVIGAGPAGYVAAIKCAQLGMSVACVDARDTLGGTCLNVGCIPSKALLHASHKYDETQHHLARFGITVEKISLDLSGMMTHKTNVVNELTKGIDFLFKKNNITRIKGYASFTSASEVTIKSDSEESTVTAKHFIIATGSTVSTLPNIQIDEQRIVSSTGALELKHVPKNMIVMGGGYIGLEMASIWQRLGANVSVIQFADRIVPAMDHEVSTALQKMLEDQGITFFLKHKVLSAAASKDSVTLTMESLDGKSSTLEADVLLVSIGRSPNTDGLNIKAAGIELDTKGFIPVNASYQTSVSNIYAIGDVIGGMMLAHKAEDEGVAVAELIAGQKPHVNYAAIPAVIYTHPEVAAVGKTENELKSTNVEYKVGKFPININARAKAAGETKGFVKVITNAKTDQILGVHIIAADAGAMIAEAALAMEYGASAEDVARTSHAHPTTAEALKEASMAAWNKAIHL
ncbi:MAG: dihydrolipoyl dehydrogenase [Alphaproteobacteria bacterium]|nr:dihydrolipoyl dehydrogenase [Alphaproteobacteria bacterium]